MFKVYNKIAIILIDNLYFLDFTAIYIADIGLVIFP